MRKITCVITSKTLEEGQKEFELFCKENNFRKDTILHYYYSYRNITNFISPNTLLADINEQTYKDYCLYLQGKNINQQTIQTYLKGFKRLIDFFIDKEYVEPFKMKLPKIDKRAIETYSDEEIRILLKKPNIRKCIFTEYRNWVLVNFLLSTGLRVSSVVNIKIKDIDFESQTLNVTHTKNRKPLIIPLNTQIIKILKEYLEQRGGEPEEVLFCTIWGKQMDRQSLGTAIRGYNKRRGVKTCGLHRFRHTFAKKFVMNGGSVAVLQRLLGHSSLDMTQKYINILTSDLNKEVNNYNILQEFSTTRIKMKRR